TDPNGNPVALTQNPDGSYSATVPAPAVEGDYEVTATDGTNSSSDTATLTDNVAPEIEDAVINPNSDGSATITVTVDDPGAVVTVTLPDNTVITLANNGDGTHSATVPAPAVEGDYTVTATDGTNSATGTATLTDNVAPAIDEFTVEPNSDGSATITVRVDDENATVSVTDPNGNPVALTQNPDGSYSATVPAPAVEGDYEVTATDGTNSS
ncbi:hypothetical protein MXE60_12985, partial [Enterococcus hirae]|uniref:hypothetical protein n=1 Tax=Enterococcus hirae TaxID=1354 RepID=UPI002DD6533E